MIFKSVVSFCKNCLNSIKESKCNETNVATGPTIPEVETITLNINKPIYEYSHGKKFKSPPRWIVVHYTGCANVSAKAMAKSMRNNTCASSHFYIDENDICAAVPLEYIAWHVGDGQVAQPDPKNKRTLEQLCQYHAKNWRYDLAASNHINWKNEGCDFKGNSVAIGVDICVKKKNTKTTKSTDTDWYFEDNAIENIAKTVAYLAKEYGIDEGHIIRHGDATGKLCAQPFTYPFEIGDKRWKEFKSKVSHYMECHFKVNQI